jgi:hypothetical protein
MPMCNNFPIAQYRSVGKEMKYSLLASRVRVRVVLSESNTHVNARPILIIKMVA